MSDMTQYENGIVSVPGNAELVQALDKIGQDGWFPWAVLGVDESNQTVRIAVTRPKRAITLATSIPSNGIIKS